MTSTRPNASRPSGTALTSSGRGVAMAAELTGPTVAPWAKMVADRRPPTAGQTPVANPRRRRERPAPAGIGRTGDRPDRGAEADRADRTGRLRRRLGAARTVEA